MTPEEREARASVGLASIADQARVAANMPSSVQSGSSTGMFGQGSGPKLADLLAYKPAGLFDAPVVMAASRGPATDAALQEPSCTLVPPTGRFDAHGVDARFETGTAQKLSNAIANLNSQGITLVITSGYRNPDDQAILRAQPGSTSRHIT